jgi:NAD(P)-dependent dehydrogenase (short-subunit alcohol dehydrogenase family)
MSTHGRFDNPVVAALAGFWDLFRKQQLSDRLTDNDRFDGKTCLITGANSGLGFALAVEIAKRGGHIIMAGRSAIPGAGEKVKKLSGSDKVEMMHLDLSKINSINDFISKLSTANIKFDITILNAGVALPKARKTDSGLEEMFLVNYLSNVILTNLMIDNKIIDLEANKTFKPRIIFISSDSHQGSSRIDFDELGKYMDYGPSKGIANYSYYKLVLNTYAVELSRRINKEGMKASVLVICPGPVHSNIVKEAPYLLRVTLKAIFWVIFRSPKKAALPVVYMAISPDYEGRTEQYQHMFKEKRMDEKVYDEEDGRRLWEASLGLWKSVDTDH